MDACHPCSKLKQCRHNTMVLLDNSTKMAGQALLNTCIGTALPACDAHWSHFVQGSVRQAAYGKQHVLMHFMVLMHGSSQEVGC